jgi:hypothetical protein
MITVDCDEMARYCPQVSIHDILLPDAKEADLHSEQDQKMQIAKNFFRVRFPGSSGVQSINQQRQSWKLYTSSFIRTLCH